MYIYKITNNLNNKNYIGLKTKTVEESESYYGSGVAVNRAINKYGKHNFTKTILERDIVDYDYLKDREQYWIQYYDSYNNGYNMTLGGDGLLGYVYTEEHRRKISISTKGRRWTMSEEGRRNISKAHMGVKQGPCSEETKRRMSKAKLGVKRKPLSDEHKKLLSEINLGNTHSDKTKQKMKEAYNNRSVLECPQCGFKSKNRGAMTRHHFDNCKQKP